MASDRVRIAYQVRGDGPPLVLLAGQANDHHWWDGVRNDFAGSRSTVTIDYRGTGQSDKPNLPYSIARFADDVVAVLDALSLERVDVYGTSMGGRVAQRLAIGHSRRVRALVLGCTSAGGRHAVDRGDSVRRDLFQPDPVKARQALLELMYSPAWLATHSGPCHVLGDRSMPVHARRGHLVASDEHDAWDALPGIAAPTLVLHGTDDLLAPAANASLLAARIPGSRLEWIQGARHAYFEECRDIAGPLVLEFLDQKVPRT
ncbi:alpha/beta fold hydrolase [Streptomyces sp. NPDC046977]|uniref:alpha/beta fold hydrolase n=1 Tax=Streptomyces sp. NPDC046977 TaxID=3154703 RepID=UPI0033C72A96